MEPLTAGRELAPADISGAYGGSPSSPLNGPPV